MPNNRRICYACADKREIERLKTRPAVFVAYVDSKGLTITTWTGGKLMTITKATHCRLTRPSFLHGKSIMSIHAVDVHGAHWAGRGNAGIAIRLRPVKGPTIRANDSELLTALKGLKKNVEQDLAGYWTESTANMIQQADKAIANAERSASQ